MSAVTETEALRLRPTGIQTFLGCPRKFFYQEIERVPRLTSAALAIGTGFHRASEVLVSALKAGKRPKDVLPAAEATLEEQITFERTLGNPDPDDDKFETAKDTGIALLRTAAEAIPETWRPVFVEETVQAEVAPSVIVSGTTDLVLDDGTIVDFKTRARKSDPAEVRRDLQFTAYAVLRNAADGRNGDNRKITVVEVTKTKTPQVVIHETSRDGRDYETWRGIVEKVSTAIRAGFDPPAPSSFCKSCGWRGVCPAYRG